MTKAADYAQDLWALLEKRFPSDSPSVGVRDAYIAGLADARRDLCATIAIADAVRISALRSEYHRALDRAGAGER